MNANIVIAGGGLGGLSQALAFAHHGITSTLIERGQFTDHAKPGFDGRTSFLALSNKELYSLWGAWDQMLPHAEPVKDIRILDGDSPFFLHYDHEELGVGPMGYIIENTHLRRALIQAVKQNPLITVLENTSVLDAEPDAHHITLSLTDQKKIKAKLLVIAEGRGSDLREKAGIKVRTHDYRQTAIICAVKHEKSHGNAAIERFLPAGPFAILPLPGGMHSSLVWTERAHLAQYYMEMNDADFIAAITERFGDYLGKLTLASPRWQYPLSLTHAETLYGPRQALVGDSAHAIHPIAGQGFNLSMRDIETLSNLVAGRLSLGLDIGAEDMLSEYQRTRKADNFRMIAATDGLNRLFSNSLPGVTLARRLGLGFIEKMPGLKKRFMRQAMGLKKSA